MKWLESKLGLDQSESADRELETSIRHCKDRVRNLNAPKILILDGDTDFLALMISCFSKFEVEIECYTRFYDFVKAIERCNARAILLDCDMQGHDGLKVYNEIRYDPELRDVKIIFFSGEEKYKQIIPDGTGFVMKNGNPDQFVKQVLEQMGG